MVFLLKRWCAVVGLCVLSVPAFAQNDDAFVEANLLSVLYHELGHAIIDVMRLPVFGQEENAADVASILLINDLFDEEVAPRIAYDAAFGFLGEARVKDGEQEAWWDVHGPDLQRFYTLVCLFAGADFEARDDIARDLGLPDDRMDTCEEEFELAHDSWAPVFDELAEEAPGQSLIFDGDVTNFTERLVAGEVAALNEDFVFPQPITIRVDTCDEPNAFYDPQRVEIVVCAEFEAWLRELPVPE
ncbi:DUF4344 domain-containing metallopeptidase [Ascidiaceihabitans sp.]|uniref:DUF4344 domain-containing metallopeptidase n=1 Tax=Ascidiaceihabitans sp. TaxID=1872644 RepID=UPI00329A51AD